MNKIKNFEKYCYEIQDRHYNCNKEIKRNYGIIILGVLFSAFSFVFTFYLFIAGIVSFLLFGYLIFKEKNFWFSEIPHHAYTHFGNLDQETSKILLQVMHKNNRNDPKLVNFNIFFPFISKIIARNEIIYYSYDYCYNKSKLDENLRKCINNNYSKFTCK